MSRRIVSLARRRCEPGRAPGAGAVGCARTPRRGAPSRGPAMGPRVAAKPRLSVAVAPTTSQVSCPSRCALPSPPRQPASTTSTTTSMPSALPASCSKLWMTPSWRSVNPSCGPWWLAGSGLVVQPARGGYRPVADQGRATGQTHACDASADGRIATRCGVRLGARRSSPVSLQVPPRRRRLLARWWYGDMRTLLAVLVLVFREVLLEPCYRLAALRAPHEPLRHRLG